MLRSRPTSFARSLAQFMNRVLHKHGATVMSRIQSGSITNQLTLKPSRLLSRISSVCSRSRHRPL